MIVTTDKHPEKDLYYLGAQVIEELALMEDASLDYFDLYERFNRRKPISINLFALVIDWLFILGVVTCGDKGLIKKCF